MTSLELYIAFALIGFTVYYIVRLKVKIKADHDNLQLIKKRVDDINEDLHLDENMLPSYGSHNSELPNNEYVAYEKGGYSYVAYGHYRSKEQEHLIINTKDVDELLFEIFKHSTFMAAFDYERKNRVEAQDCRIIAFQKHIEILNSLHLKREFIIKLKERYDYLLSLKEPLPVPDNWSNRK